MIIPMRIFTHDFVASGKALRAALAAVALIGSAGAGGATDYRATGAPQDGEAIYEHLSLGVARPRMDRSAFDRSGTAGRLDLGEDPRRPEGSGNLSE